MNYFSEISKIMKSQMAQIVPVIIEPIISATANKVVEVDVAKDEDEFDLDSDDDHDHDHVMMDLEGIDE